MHHIDHVTINITGAIHSMPKKTDRTVIGGSLMSAAVESLTGSQ